MLVPSLSLPSPPPRVSVPRPPHGGDRPLRPRLLEVPPHVTRPAAPLVAARRRHISAEAVGVQRVLILRAVETLAVELLRPPRAGAVPPPRHQGMEMVEAPVAGLVGAAVMVAADGAVPLTPVAGAVCDVVQGAVPALLGRLPPLRGGGGAVPAGSQRVPSRPLVRGGDTAPQPLAPEVVATPRVAPIDSRLTLLLHTGARPREAGEASHPLAR